MELAPQVLDTVFTGTSTEEKKPLEFPLPRVAELMGVPYQSLYTLIGRSLLTPYFRQSATFSDRMLRSTEVLLLMFASILKDHGVWLPTAIEHLPVLYAGIEQYYRLWRKTGGRPPEVWLVLVADPGQDEVVYSRNQPTKCGAAYEIRVSLTAMFDRTRAMYERIHGTKPCLTGNGGAKPRIVH